MKRQEVVEILSRYNVGSASESEKELIESWYLQLEYKGLADLPAEERTADLERIALALPALRQHQPSRFKWFLPLSAAATALIVLGTCFYFFTANRREEQITVIKEINESTEPGSDKAILILSDGKKVDLSASNTTRVIAEGPTTITKTSEGSLKYSIGNSGESRLPANAFNTLVTPAGGTFSLTLSDGTKVRLDAESSIHYPVRFQGSSREVNIQGQAFFEVAPDKKKPFKVETNHQTIEVLGTHFNVNAFSKQNIITTLVEGKINVRSGSRSAILSPGQQSTIASQTREIKVVDADVNTVIGWKEGYFKFRRASLPTVLDELSRWYNIEVSYEGSIPKLSVTGKVKRSEEVGQVLEILSKLGVRFRKDGRKVIIKEN